jgi:hypothetical protein
MVNMMKSNEQNQNKFDKFFICSYQTFKMGFLCREQIMKGLYLAIGSKHQIPKDLLLIIYRLAKDDSLERDYHRDAIYRNTLPFIDHSHESFLPVNLGLEWAIRWLSHKKEKLHTQICILGEKDYLLKRVDYVKSGHGFQYFMKRAHNSLKVKYLNTSPMEEVLEDYLTYLETDGHPGDRLCIDEYGEAVWAITLDS